MSSPAFVPPTISKPHFEHHHSGFGIGTARPRISWSFFANTDLCTGWFQTTYEIEVAILLEDTLEVFLVESERSILVPWPAKDLKSRDRAKIRVRCYGKSDRSEQDKAVPTEWSPEAIVEVGFLDAKEWTASFITARSRIEPSEPLQPLRFRKEFKLLPIRSRSCRLVCTSHPWAFSDHTLMGLLQAGNAWHLAGRATSIA